MSSWHENTAIGHGAANPEAPSCLASPRAGGRLLADETSRQQGSQPLQLLESLVEQVQLLACLQWLGEFQLLACIPPDHSAPMQDLADLAVVPHDQLRRVVRMVATAGFLCEPQPDHVAHTPLSAQFVERPSLLDALMFVGGTMAPAALQMANATRKGAGSKQPETIAFNLATQFPESFATACKQRPTLHRQARAYHLLSQSSAANRVAEALNRLNWHSIGEGTVVEVGAHSLVAVKLLAQTYPRLRFVVQVHGQAFDSSFPGNSLASTSDQHRLFQPSQSRFSTSSIPGSPATVRSITDRITVQRWSPGTVQTVESAATYIIHVPSPSLWVRSHTLPGLITAELKAHLNVLRNQSNVTLILVGSVSTEREGGSADSQADVAGRTRDLYLQQIAGQQELELSDLVDAISNVRDNRGRLVLANKLHSPFKSIMLLEVRYQPSTDSFMGSRAR